MGDIWNNKSCIKGRMMLILGCNNKLYLLLHLSSFKKNVGQKVYIGDVVA